MKTYLKYESGEPFLRQYDLDTRSQNEQSAGEQSADKQAEYEAYRDEEWER